MANNYPFDSNNVPPASQSGAGGSVPETPFTPATPGGGQSSPPPQSGGNSNRLAPGISLSGGRYKIEKLIAAGGMGAVYRAIDTRFNRPCAVKEMLDNFSTEAERAQAIEWFAREATLLLDLNHPCIPRVRDYFDEDGKNYLVMDLIEGATLSSVMVREGTVEGVNGARGVSEARARSWTQQICGVLSYLHRLSPPIIFRDLKPPNVMVTNRDEVKLIDFGIARTFQTKRQATVIMTLGYAPPEQLHGMPEPRSDIYALGATIHRVLTGHDAANNKPNIFSFPPIRTLRPDISPAFEQILMRALAPNIDQRWPNAAEMERALVNLPPLGSGVHGGAIRPSGGGGLAQTTNPIQGTGPRSMTGAPATHTMTGPAGSYITAALHGLAATPPRLAEVEHSVKLAHTMEPNNSQVHKIFGRIFAHQQPPNVANAINAYTRSLELYPDDPETHKLLGDVWLYLRPNYAQAIPAYAQSLRLKADDFETHERIAICYEKTGQLELALRDYQEAARQAASSNRPAAVRLRLHQAVGHLARHLQQLPVAENAFIQVLFLNPSDHQARFILAQIYEQEGKLAEALRECRYVLGPLGATNPMVHQMHNRLRMRLGQ